MSIVHSARITDTRLGAHSNNEVLYALEEGAAQVSYVPLVSSSHSNQGTNWSLNNISQYTARDSRLNVSMTITATLSMTNTTGGALSAINVDNFGPRQFPYNRAISSVNHKINQAAYVLNTSQILDAIARVNMHPENCNFYDNTQPDLTDSYANATGTNLSPIGSYTSSIQGNGIFKPRSLNYTVSGNSIAANATSSVVITMQIYEPLISPFNNIGDKNSEALYAINGELIQISYVNDLWSNMFSYVVPAGLTLNNATVSLGTTATLNCIYLVPSDMTIARLPKQSVYHYNDYNVSSIDIGACAAGATIQTSSQVANFTNIPQKVLVYARLSDSARTVSSTDKYLLIQNISLQWDNGLPVLSQANTNQLYDVSTRNGLTMPRACFNQQCLNQASVAAVAAPALFGCGSVAVFDPALDFALRPNQTNGSAGRFVLQVQNAIFKNNTNTNYANCTLYIVGINNAVLERIGSEYRNYLLSVSPQLLQESKELPPIALDVYNSQKFDNLFLNGGGIGDWFKKQFENLKSGVKKAASKGAEYLAQHPEAIADVAKQAASYLGRGGALMKRHSVRPQKMDLFFE